MVDGCDIFLDFFPVDIGVATFILSETLISDDRFGNTGLFLQNEFAYSFHSIGNPCENLSKISPGSSKTITIFLWMVWL